MTLETEFMWMEPIRVTFDLPDTLLYERLFRKYETLLPEGTKELIDTMRTALRRMIFVQKATLPKAAQECKIHNLDQRIPVKLDRMQRIGDLFIPVKDEWEECVREYTRAHKEFVRRVKEQNPIPTGALLGIPTDIQDRFTFLLKFSPIQTKGNI
tara:strand:+ start:1566 stop:2030 length:465 start_codon:yes stop_codon:yes gene_type:complete